ncbi:TD and POZ domain-containing protein 3 [Trichonephila clavata]|uniref:TD and POZ domain-containing protein 3 n=1 Tax=Trichonephila clavata TaxID=2740835 RepID=A0A8X6KGA0_TRICU|nr:TD and POZ domain-containing protein 3 [Trichonephila clavata]
MAENVLKSLPDREADLHGSTQLKNVIFLYEWNIGNFSSYLDRKYEILSPSFSFDQKGETKWKLVLFPKQSYPEGTELNVKLVKMSNDGKSHGVKYKVSAVSRLSSSKEMFWKEKIFRYSHDFDEFAVISLSNLKGKKYLQDDTLTIRCEMDVLFAENQNEDNLQCASAANQNVNDPNINHFSNNIFTESPIKSYMVKETKIKNCDHHFYSNGELNCSNMMLEKSSFTTDDGLSGLSDDFKGLYLSKNFADIIILSEGTQMFAHKAILSARSEYFKMLCSGKGPINNTLELPDVKSAVMEAVLYYLYTSKTRELTPDFAIDMLSAAKKLCLHQLQQTLINFLKINISVENVTEILQLSEEQNLEDLKNACLKFINSHHSTVVRSHKWQIMIRNNPRIAGQVLLAVAAFQNHNPL